MTKQDIRRVLKKTRKKEVFVAEKSQKICALLKSSEVFQKAKTILFFSSIQNEPNLLPLAERFFSKKRIFFPKITDAIRGTMKAVEVSHFSELESSDFGILAPRGDDFFSPRQLDLILVPALAVDLSGNRIGFGGGFYDRFLSETIGVKIAVVFDFQILSEIPSEIWDQKMDGIVSECRFSLPLSPKAPLQSS